MEMPFAFQAMNTDFLVDGVSEAAAIAVQERVKAAEAMFSRFAPDSEINRINHRIEEWTAVSPLTYDLLFDAVTAFRATEGLFNPFLGLAMNKLGYDRSFELLQKDSAQVDVNGWRRREAEENRRIVESPTSSIVPLELDPQQQAAKLQSGFALDVGGIAKGWTAQRAADGLMAQGVQSGLVDAGGDVVLWGKESKQGVWGIGVADPMGSDEDIADLWCEDLTAMATSSIVKRSWQAPGRGAVHHIIDPRTGISAQSDLLQVTVLARDLSVAEQYAKCLIVLGSVIGFPWITKRQPQLAYIGVQRDGLIRVSDNLDLYAKEWEVKKHVEWNNPKH
ncbi:MAG TPA: FAD:protein FMN transferase [Negativicutes bacterium]|nr:FAD:protein FMN transferase [Negativicutes bacterium]